MPGRKKMAEGPDIAIAKICGSVRSGAPATFAGCTPITRVADMPVVKLGRKTSTRLMALLSESATYRRPAVSKAMAAGVAN